jgi:hypothetical protein
MDWFRGKKTLIVAVLMFVIGTVNMLASDMSVQGVFGLLMSEEARMMFEGLGLGFLRMGVASK